MNGLSNEKTGIRFRDIRIGNLLIAEAVPLAAVRTLPGDAVAGHSPEVILHAFLTDLKTAAARPAKWEYACAADAMIDFGASFFFSIGRFD
ncbi:MAG: hypothetical protein AB1427_08140 [Thermodesulfobacteriota bacterium]